MDPEIRPLRVTFITPFAGMAGGIRVIAIYAQHLRRRGHEVRWISTPWWPAGRLARARTHVHEWLERMNLRPRDPSHLDGLEIEHIALRDARPVIDSDVPDGDVVIATWWETAPWVADLSSRKGAKVYFVQDYGAHEGQPLDQVARTWKLPLDKIVISKWLLRLVQKQSGDCEATYVPNAVDLEQFHAPPRSKQRKPTFGFVYSAAPQKGCDVILKALQLARKRWPQLQVMSFGPGSPEAEFPGRLPAGAQYFSCAPEHQLHEIYSSCDAWLFGSRLEGFGLPILEAMACRTPVIATPAGAAPDLLQGGGGILVKPDCPEAMCDAIGAIASLSDPVWRAMSDAAYATASKYTWENATDLFEAALFAAIARQREKSLAAV